MKWCPVKKNLIRKDHPTIIKSICRAHGIILEYLVYEIHIMNGYLVDIFWADWEISLAMEEKINALDIVIYAKTIEVEKV